AATVSLGWIATAAYTSSYSAAHAADQREDSRVVPTVMTRAIPAARAAASTAVTSGGRPPQTPPLLGGPIPPDPPWIMSRWVWLSSAGLGRTDGGTGAVTTDRSAGKNGS